MSGTKNKIQDLRDHLFETLEDLRDKEAPMDLERAKAIANVAQAIIHSAKVEVDFLRVVGGAEGTGFIEDRPALPSPGQSTGTALTYGPRRKKPA